MRERPIDIERRRLAIEILDNGPTFRADLAGAIAHAEMGHDEEAMGMALIGLLRVAQAQMIRDVGTVIAATEYLEGTGPADE